MHIYTTARVILKLVTMTMCMRFPSNGVLYLASRMQRRNNVRDPLFGYYSAEIMRFNRPASSATMLILIFNRMSNRKEHAQWANEFNRQTKTHSIAHHFVVNYLCERFEAFKLSGGNQITMLELLYVSESCKPISYLEDNFRQSPTNIHLSLLCLSFGFALRSQLRRRNPESINFAIGLSLRIWLELVQRVWHIPLTQTKFSRLRSVPKMVSARKTHFWQFADDEKILRPTKTRIHTHTRHMCAPSVWAYEM